MSAPASPALIASGPGAFAAAELDNILLHGDGLDLMKASLGGRSLDENYDGKRITRVAAIDPGPQTMWIYRRMLKLVAILNKRYRFALEGFIEPIQYTVYRDVEGSHFGWHADQGPTVRRKLSLTVQLTDPSQYEGCELQFKVDGKIDTAPRARGMLIAFPSHVMHRVTPITAGTRKALVAWIAG
jgi:PKHD-type hydroxylase